MERFATLMWSLWKAWCSWVFDGRLLDVASVAQLQMIELCSATWSLPDALRMLSKGAQTRMGATASWLGED